jgi:hypothetical protein
VAKIISEIVKEMGDKGVIFEAYETLRLCMAKLGEEGQIKRGTYTHGQIEWTMYICLEASKNKPNETNRWKRLKDAWKSP